MIPQRVTIEGFLSYRQQVEFSFDGAPIWMLTGENGAGKSSVFDAITFALYGVHRGGKGDVEELINRSSDRLAVEFDFMVGEDCYRVQRTVARVGGPTFQAIHLRGPNPPNRQRSGAQPVPGTSSKSGLTQWVERRLGLDSKAFKMSVLLEQGKSDALLSAEPRERHDLLSQLVDLSRYEALESAARKRQTEVNASVQRNKAELATLPVVTPIQIANQEECAAEAKRLAASARQQLEGLQALKVYAARWGELQNQQTTIGNKQRTMQLLLAETDAIQRDAQRLHLLQKTLPVLQRIHQHRQNQTLRQQEANTHKAEALVFAATVAEETPLLAEAESDLARWQKARELAQGTEFAALQTLNDLQGAIHQIDEMERLCKAITLCDEKLRQFSSDLDQQAKAAACEVEELVALAALLPHAQRYVETRHTWQKTSASLEDDLQLQHEDGKRVAAALGRATQAQAALAQAREQMDKAQREKAVAERDLKVIREQIERFEQVGSKPTCPYCGQPLSAEHLGSERARLETTLADHLAATTTGARVEAAGKLALGEAETQAKTSDSEHHKALQAQRETIARCERLLEERGRVERDGWQALEKLRVSHNTLFALPQAPAIDLCFGEEEPTTGELEQLAARAAGYDATLKRLQLLQQSVTTRAGHRSSRLQLEEQLHPLAESYPPARAQEIRTQSQATIAVQLEAKRQVARVTPLLEETKGHLVTHRQRLQDAQKKQLEAEQKANSAELLANNAQQLAADEIKALPADWQVMAHALDGTQLAELQLEIRALAGAEARKQALLEAQTQLAHIEERLREIEAELQSIPAAAQRPLAELLDEEKQARSRQEAGERQFQQASHELVALENRRQRIEVLAAATRVAEKKAAHYALIVRYLGRDYLQRFLLQQAEQTIVSLGNGVLDHCSGGTLSMELRPHNEEGATQKAFDLMVENHATHSTQTKMLPAWLLSGSQRFRVAISLALAIGQYASNNGQRIESVIIDEGFGSLDRQGLRDMEDALRDLGGISDEMIKRIILVSHQDDFAKAFPHRYAVRLEDGASQAELVEAVESI